MRDGESTVAMNEDPATAAAVQSALMPAETYQIDSDEYDSGEEGSDMADDEYDRLVEEGQPALVSGCWVVDEGEWLIK